MGKKRKSRLQEFLPYSTKYSIFPAFTLSSLKIYSLETVK